MTFASEPLRRVGYLAWLWLLAATPAIADRAEDEFKRGRELMKAERYAEACALFESSDALDPQDGTRFNLAQCREKLGKFASALRLYRQLAREDKNPTRREAARKLASELEGRVPSIHVQVADAPAGTSVALDGAACGVCLAGPVPVDLGRIRVVVRAPERDPVEEVVNVSEPGKTYPVAIQLPAARSIVVPIERQAPPPSTSSSRKTWGIITLALGGAGLATGGVFGYLSRDRWAEARAICGGDVICDTTDDAMRAQAIGDEAREHALVSTIGFAAGGAFALLGIVLVATSPSERAVTMSASATGDTATVIVGGTF